MKSSVEHLATWTIILVYISVVVTSCAKSEAIESAEVSEITESPPTLVAVSTSTLPFTATATSSPMPTNTPTPKPSITPTSTNEPTKTATPVPETPPSSIPLFTTRYPSIEELEIYLTKIASEEIPFYRPFSENVELIYEDVNGDGEADLIISDFLLVSVLLWEGIQYGEPFLYQLYPFKYDPGSRVYLEDWTNDGVPEIIFDHRSDTGGTGIRHTVWTKYVIHCTQEDNSTCGIVWGDELATFTEDYNEGGLGLFQADIERIIKDDFVSLEVTNNLFSVYSLGGYLDPSSNDYQIDSIKVFTSTLSTFIWNGHIFERQNTETIKPAYKIDAQADLEAVSNTGHTVRIEVETENSATNQNDSCQLFVDDTAIGTPFGCKQDFTTADWQDITNDGNEELIIIALSGLPVAEKQCIHQRFIAYQWIDSQMVEIANIVGCVVQSDLYGIRFQDIEEDGQIEIIAADGWFTGSKCWSSLPDINDHQDNCWYEFGHRDEVYKWNGSEFVYWSLLPEQDN